MEIKNLIKAGKIVEQIQNLDKEIIQIEKTAELIVNGDTKASFKMNIIDLVEKEKKYKKVMIDPDGSLSGPRHDSPIKIYGLFFTGVPGFHEKEKTEESTNKIEMKLTDNESLSVLGILIGIKQRKRADLINELSKFGIQ